MSGTGARWCLAAAIGLALVTGCAMTPRVSAASNAECAASLREVGLKALHSPDSTRFTVAMTSLAGSVAMASIGTTFTQGLGAIFDDDDSPSVQFAAPDSAVIQGALCDALNGLSARQIIARSDSLRPVVTEAFERRYAHAKIQALDSARARAAAVTDSLAQFRVESARLVQEKGWLGLEATIVLKVANGTSHAVSRAYFQGRVVSAGRSVPWIEHAFNYQIPGGLEPKESATWQLSPSMAQGAWTSVPVPKDATLEVQVTKLAGPDGELLWGGPSFTTGDQALLDSLVTRFGRGS